MGSFLIGHMEVKYSLLYYVLLIVYRIRGNFQGSYISRITCKEGFRILIFADDLPLNHYYYYHGLLIEIFED